MNGNAYISHDPEPAVAAQGMHAPVAGWGPGQAIQEVRELRDGYAFLVADNPVPVLMVLELFKPDHLTYRLLRIAVEDQADNCATWVHVTGSRDVKSYLRSALFLDHEAAQPRSD